MYSMRTKWDNALKKISKIPNTYEIFSDISYDYYCHIITILSLLPSNQNQYWQYILICEPSIHLQHHYHMKPITWGLRREETNASGPRASEWYDWERKEESQKQFASEPIIFSDLQNTTVSNGFLRYYHKHLLWTDFGPGIEKQSFSQIILFTLHNNSLNWCYYPYFIDGKNKNLET